MSLSPTARAEAELIEQHQVGGRDVVAPGNFHVWKAPEPEENKYMHRWGEYWRVEQRNWILQRGNEN